MVGRLDKSFCNPPRPYLAQPGSYPRAICQSENQVPYAVRDTGICYEGCERRRLTPGLKKGGRFPRRNGLLRR